MIDRPLMVQSDRTMLLDVHSPSFKECRHDIMAFSDLVKSPEHIHTYVLSPITLWNAVSSGLTAEEIVEKLNEMELASSIYITVESLKYLRKSGRLSGIEAFAGEILNIGNSSLQKRMKRTFVYR